MHKPESGFSVLELVIVLAIMLIVVVIAFPTIRELGDSYRLQASSQDVAEVLRQAQMKAVQTNQVYYVQYGGFCGGVDRVCAVPAARFVVNTYIQGDPYTSTSVHVDFTGAGPGSSPPNLGAPLQPVGAVIGFNARGIPCVAGGVAAANPFVCQGPAAFEWFLETNSTGNARHAWAAVTVTPAGRVRSWRMSAPGVWN